MDPTALINEIAVQVSKVDGVEGVVLGGSRARGSHLPGSDIDIGIYYQPGNPLDLERLGQLAEDLDDHHRAGLLTELGGWGPWINGGGWLTVQSIPVDFLYRDLHKVKGAIDDCLEGKIAIAYQPGHPQGFTTMIYMGEIAVCKILSDPHGLLAGLKQKADPYPLALREAVLRTFFWECEFSLQIARKGADHLDVGYTAGCCFRCVACLLQSLFALNGVYWLNEKGAVALAEHFEIHPADLEGRINRTFESLSGDRRRLNNAIDQLDELVRETGPLIEAGV